jgi:hypothetical protein
MTAFLRLPNELFLLIVAFIDVEDILSLRKVRLGICAQPHPHVLIIYAIYRLAALFTSLPRLQVSG